MKPNTKKRLKGFITSFITIQFLEIVGLVFAISYPNPLKVLQSKKEPDINFVKNKYKNTPYWFFSKKTSDVTIVVVHGKSRNKGYMSPLIEAIWNNTNINILAIDLPSHGERKYGRTSIGPKEKSGIHEALEWLHKNGHNNIILLGVSMGGSAILHAIPENKLPITILGVITDGTYANLDMLLKYNEKKYFISHQTSATVRKLVEWWCAYKIAEANPEKQAKMIAVPLLVLHGDKDNLAPPESAFRIAQQAPDALGILYDGEHDKPDNLALQKLVIEFINIQLSEQRLQWKSILRSKIDNN